MLLARFGDRKGDHLLHKVRLRLGIGFDVGAVFASQVGLQPLIAFSPLRMGAQVVAEGKVGAPLFVALLVHMDVRDAVARRRVIALDEVVAAGDAILAEVAIAERREQLGATGAILEAAEHRHNVDHRLGCKARDSRAPDVFDGEEEVAAGPRDLLAEACELLGPGLVIGDEDDGT